MEPRHSPLESETHISISSVARAEEATLQNLFQLYTHDFSELWSGTNRGELSLEGRFEPYPLEAYWARPDWLAGLIWCGRALAGFVLVDDRSHIGERVDHSMAEMFVVRKHRRRGVGHRVARAVIAERAGTWEIAVARKNVAAARFWRRTVEGAKGVTGLKEIDVEGGAWNGPVLRFESKGVSEGELDP